MFVHHRKHAYGTPRPVTGTALLLICTLSEKKKISDINANVWMEFIQEQSSSFYLPA
jgi:hypothetical protein